MDQARSFVYSKGNNRQNRKMMETASDRGSMSKIYKELMQLSSHKTAQDLKMNKEQTSLQ